MLLSLIAFDSHHSENILEIYLSLWKQMLRKSRDPGKMKGQVEPYTEL